MSADDLLTEERRARMAAERQLAKKKAELFEANKMLSRHAITLSEDLVETREEVVEARHDLERATHEVDIAKRRLWSSVETIQDGFAVFDAESRLVIANPAYYAPFDGLECVRPGVFYDEIIEAALSEGVVDIGERSAPEWRDWMLQRWQSESPEPREIRFWNGSYVRLVDRRAPGGDTVSMGLDITRSIRRQKLLRDARDRAETANRAKSAFLANMSHEIRTPMNGVVAMADLMADHDLDDDLQSYVDTIRSSGRALLTIINDVLDYSKLEAEKMHLHAEPFDLERTILDVIALVLPSIREKGLKVLLDYDMFLPTRYVGDPVRIRQVLTNLIGNAVKFTTEGHVMVRVIGLPDGEAHRVHITVEDTGIGIPEELQAHVFGEFNQVEDNRNRSFEGTGLGLAITRQLIELMGGEIWVESEAGIGSAFGVSVTLPHVAEDELPPTPDWLRRALLVMADDMNRAILAKRLIALGIDIEFADGPSDGASKVHGANVIFADQRFWETARDTLCAHAPTPIIAVADPMLPASSDLPEGRVLNKPYSRPALMELLCALPHPKAPGFRSRRALETAPLTETASAPSPIETDENLFAEDTTEPPSSAPPEASTEPRQMRVLVAEDNKTNRFVFSKLVKACDIELIFAEDGEKAVAAFEKHLPDLVFMDISMPHKDGKDATRAIRTFEAETGLERTRIVALTAHAMTGDEQEIMGHGLDAHLAKPFPKDDILAEIAMNRPPEARPALPDPLKAGAQAAS